MIGQPKFKIKDLVEFSFNGSKRFGTIIIVDAFGTFRQSDEVLRYYRFRQNGDV